MPRKEDTGAKVKSYILEIMKEIHERRNIASVDKPRGLPYFKFKESIVQAVLGSEYFYDSEDLSIGAELSLKAKNGAVPVSKGTIRKAINYLIDENLIKEDDEKGFIWAEHTPLNEKYYPILSAAPHISVTVNTPESLLVLTVPPEFSQSIAAYLSAQFYKGDILFLPMANHILCLGVLSEVGFTQEKQREFLSQKVMQERIERALHGFQVSYPKFLYGGVYDVAHAAFHDPKTRTELHEIANNPVETDTSYITGTQRSPTSRFADMQGVLSCTPDAEDLLTRNYIPRNAPKKKTTKEKKSNSSTLDETQVAEEDDPSGEECDDERPEAQALTSDIKDDIDSFFDDDLEDMDPQEAAYYGSIGSRDFDSNQ